MAHGETSHAHASAARGAASSPRRHRRRGALVAIGLLSVLSGVVPATAASAQVVPSSDTTNPPLLPDFPPAMPFSRLPGQYLPPPSSGSASPAAPMSTTVAPAPHVDAPPPPELTEGWTNHSHWKADGTGHVNVQLFDAPVFRQDAQGWHGVDPSLRARADQAQPFSADKAIYPVRFARHASPAVE